MRATSERVIAYLSAPGADSFGTPVALSKRELSSEVVLIDSVILNATRPLILVSTSGLKIIVSVSSTLTKYPPMKYTPLST